MSEGPVPLVILTGFLGAGKTTLLNRVLGAQHHRRIAVIVNELGRIDIDGRLLRARAGDVVELAGGCVCHEVRTMDELWQAFDEIIARARPDCIVLETTGIAEPAPLLEALADTAGRAARARGRRAKDGDGEGEGDLHEASVVACRVVTVVDAEAGLAVLDRHAEARAQVVTADRVLLSKLDLASPAQLPALHQLLERLNPTAERASFPDTGAGSAALVPWLLADLAPRPPGPPAATHAPHSHGQLSVVALVEDAPLLAEPLLALCARLGPGLVRAKGFVQIAGDARQAFLERAGLHLQLRWGDPWPRDRAPRSEIVLIGEGLDAAALQRQLWACRAPAGGQHA
jgi:G3E family GTPase